MGGLVAAFGAGQGSHANVNAAAFAQTIGIPIFTKIVLIHEADELKEAPKAQERTQDIHNDHPVQLTIGDRRAHGRQGH